jgi:hypothetical protein
MRVTVLLAVCACLAGSELLPGWPQPVPGCTLPPPAWRREGGELLALDASGTVRWRLQLSPGCQVWPGTGGVLVADDTGLRWFGADRESRTLPPLPSDVLPLGVDHGVASFAQAHDGWRLDPGPDMPPTRIALGAEALSPALIAGRESLWLTMHALVHSDGTVRTVHRHGLAVGRGWRLVRDAQARPLVLAPDGRAWLLPPYRAGVDDERLGRDPAMTADAPRDVRMRDALRRHDWPAAQALAAGTAEHAAVAMYAGWPMPPGARDLAPMPRDPAEACLPEAGWSGGQAPRARPAFTPTLPDDLDRDHPLRDQAEPWPTPEDAQRTPIGLMLGLRSWLVEDDGERATASCRDDGALRWYTRWLPEPGLGAPGRFLAIADGRLLIGEGESRLIILDLGDGSVRLDMRPRRVPVLPGRTWPHAHGAIVLFPPGRDNHLGWIDGRDGSDHDEPLPSPARWVLALPDGEVWLSLYDGRTLAGTAPGAWRPIDLPEAVRLASDARVVDGGIAAAGQRWTWRTASSQR